MKTECSWCLKERGQAPDPEASHGMCTKHWSEFRAETMTMANAGPCLICGCYHPNETCEDRARGMQNMRLTPEQRERLQEEVRAIYPQAKRPDQVTFSMIVLMAFVGACMLFGAGLVVGKLIAFWTR